MSERTQLIPRDVNDYVLGSSRPEHPALAELRAATASVPHNVMQIGADQGHLMALLVRLIGARRCIELGTYTGYSALAVALALPPDGTIVTCDVNDEWPAVGRPFWRKAGVDSRIDLKLGPALETLDELLAAGQGGAFDFAFIDADKESYVDYWEAVVPLVRAGGLIVADNALWSGKVLAPVTESDHAIVRFDARVAADERVEQVLLSVRDGVMLARKR